MAGVASPHLTVGVDGIALVTFDDPERSVNLLTDGVMQRLSDCIAEIRTGCDAGTVRGVLFESAKSSFIAGADIDALADIDGPDRGAAASRRGQAVFGEIERLPVPTVAAIHGACLGGGTELGLACRYRLASDSSSTRIGLPEVQLGILPAWGGTTRLPRLIGLRPALELLLTGKSVDAGKAERIGLVEDTLPAESFAELAKDFLTERIRDGDIRAGRVRGLGPRLLEDTAPGRRAILAIAKRNVIARTGGHYPAPLRILELLRSALGRPVQEALALESVVAGELLASRISKNLIHVYHLRESARKSSGTDSRTPPREVSMMGVVGAGTMGGGIAQLAAYHGVDVRLKDIRRDAISLALRHASELFRSAVAKRKTSRQEADHAMDRISGSLEYTGFGTVDLVLEAVVEKMEVKRSVLSEIESVVADSCVVATNTSSLSIDRMAESLRRPERFVAMHFFNPVHKMPLVEIVRGDQTDDVTTSTIHALAVRLGKVPVIVRDGPGFLVNRILGPYLNEAGHLLDEGTSVEVIDEAAVAFGMPMGPLRLVDEVGIDVVRHAGSTLHQAFGERMKPARSVDAIAESGRLGQKDGLGFYRYQENHEPAVDKRVYALFGDGPSENEATPDRDEARDRLVLALINEAARALEDGIAASAADVDLAMIMGTGFPPFRGGLLCFADGIHPRVLVERLDRYARRLGPRFEPAPLLRDLARRDLGFYEAFPAE